jgi:hypothetical protein
MITDPGPVENGAGMDRIRARPGRIRGARRAVPPAGAPPAGWTPCDDPSRPNLILQAAREVSGKVPPAGRFDEPVFLHRNMLSSCLGPPFGARADRREENADEEAV